METGLRVLLLLIGMAIVAGIIWDFRRNAAKKSNKIKSRDRERSVLESVEEFSLEMPLDIPYEDSFIQPGPVVTKPVHKPFGNKLSKTVFVKEPVSPVVEDILLIHIMARRPQLFSGAKLIEAFNEVHLFYNDSQIFERYENIDGTGNPIFSLVSAVEPGIFELSKIETFQTPGVTLFFRVTRPNQSVAAFELMLRTAKILASRLDAELKDEKHKLLTSETIERYRDRARQQPLGFSSRTSEYM